LTKKPPPAEKFDTWKTTIASTITVSTGMAIFHRTVMRFVSARSLTPTRLIAVNTTMSATASTRPNPVRLPPSSTRPWTMWSR